MCCHGLYHGKNGHASSFEKRNGIFITKFQDQICNGDFSGRITFGLLSSFSDLTNVSVLCSSCGLYLRAFCSCEIYLAGIQDNGDVVIFSPPTIVDSFQIEDRECRMKYISSILRATIVI